MIGYLPKIVTPGEPLDLEPSVDPPTFFHPSAALTVAQSIAFSQPGNIDMSPAAVLLVWMPDGWATGCADCLVRTNGRHDCTSRSGDVVTPFESVFRPANEIRKGPA